MAQMHSPPKLFDYLALSVIKASLPMQSKKTIRPLIFEADIIITELPHRLVRGAVDLFTYALTVF